MPSKLNIGAWQGLGATGLNIGAYQGNTGINFTPTFTYGELQFINATTTDNTPDFNYGELTIYYETVSTGGTTVWVNVAGVWKAVTTVSINVAGVWKTVSSVKVNVAGTWK